MASQQLNLKLMALAVLLMLTALRGKHNLLTFFGFCSAPLWFCSHKDTLVNPH